MQDVLRAYIREIDQNGLLEDAAPDPKIQPVVTPITEQWVESIKSPVLVQAPPSFDSLHTNSENVTAKEMVINEENMKFAPSMKVERATPESGPVQEDSDRQLYVKPSTVKSSTNCTKGLSVNLDRMMNIQTLTQAQTTKPHV